MIMASPEPPSLDEVKALPLAERLAVGLLCVAAVVGPLALGATGTWVRFGLELAMTAAVTLWVAAGRGTWRDLMLPLGVAGLFLLQLVPLPDGLLAALSPLSAARWKVARQGLEPVWATMSLEPTLTATAIRRLFLGLATVSAVTNLAREPGHRRWFFGALALSGALIWAAAFVFPVDPVDRLVMRSFSLDGPIQRHMTPDRSPLQTSGCGYLDWVGVGEQRYQVDDPIRGDGFGSYIYSNHFANALCLTLPALWAAWMALAARKRFFAAVRFCVLMAAMLLAGWTTGSLAHSRAGTAALVFTALVYVSLAATGRWLRWPAGTLAIGTALGLIGFVATVQGPFSGVLDVLPDSLHMKLPFSLVDTRIGAARVAGRMFLGAPLLGVGLGTFGDLYPTLLPGQHIMWFAHNEYAQLLAESGMLGASLLAAAAGMLVWRLWQCRREQPASQRTFDAGAWAAVGGAASHAIFDWGMHAPANAFLACIVAGLALSSVPLARSLAHDTDSHPRGLAIIFAVACLAVMVLLGRDAFSAHTLGTLRRATTAARLADLKPDAPPPAPRLRDAIRAGTRSFRLDPGNSRLAAALAQANLHLAHVARDEQERQKAGLAVQDWSGRARRDSAVARGLPEPLPPTRNRPE